MERCEARAPRDGARRPWRLTDRQLRHIVRRAGQARAAGARAVQLHGVVILLRQPGRRQHGCWQQRRSSSAVADDAPTASSAKPEQLSKRKQRSSMRLADFQRRMELQRAQAAAKLLQLWSVVWLQRLVRRRLAERSTLAAEVALVREPGADAGLQEAKADASEECVAPEASAATVRAGAVAARKRKVGSRAEVPPAKAEAWLGALSTSPGARPEAAEAVVAAAAAAAGGARVPSAAERKRRVDFSAPVPPSKRGLANLGGGAIGGSGGGGGGAGGGGRGGGDGRLRRRR